MSFRTVDLEKAAKVGGNYIMSSGLYDVTIHAVTVDTNENDAKTLGLFVNYNGNDQMLYGALGLDLYDGRLNDSGYATFDRLAVVAGIDGDIADPEETTLPIGKGGADKDVSVLPDFADVECKIWIRCEYYRKKDGTIGENRVLVNAFRADGASAEEILNETEVGVRLQKQANLSNDFTANKYSKKGDVTAEDVDAWIAGGRGQDAKPSAPTKAPSFGAKKSFGKK